MPTMKVGQVSSNTVSDLQQKHWDLDRKIGETLGMVNLNVKAKLALRIPQLVEEINAEIQATENDI